MRGPIPVAWLSRVCKLGGKCPQIALALWTIAGLRGSLSFRLEPKWFRIYNVGRKAMYRGLKSMADQNLVSLKRMNGQCYIVELQETGMVRIGKELVLRRTHPVQEEIDSKSRVGIQPLRLNETP